jgi:hypothetical protein
MPSELTIFTIFVKQWKLERRKRSSSASTLLIPLNGKELLSNELAWE